MDTDWCLHCECAFEGTGPYCSPACQHSARPQFADCERDVIYHDVRWSTAGPAAIRAWAAHIEPSSPTSSPGPSTPPPSRRSSNRSSPRPSTARLPALMRPSQRPARPALGISVSRPPLPSPSRPLRTPPQPRPTVYQDKESIANASFYSGATESSLATPASASLAVPVATSTQKTSLLTTLANQVCSWVAPTPPLLASPVSAKVKQHFVSPPDRTANFTVVAHTRPSPALDVFEHDMGSEDDRISVWRLTSSVALDPPPNKKISVDLDSRPRGRKLFRS